MVENPRLPAPIPVADPGDAPTRKHLMADIRKIPVKDPDAEFDKLITLVETTVTNVDAKLLRESHGKLVPHHFRSLRELMADPTIRKRVRDHVSGRDLKDLNEKLQESAFALGLYPDEQSSASSGNYVIQISDVALPSLNSPYSKQQLWVDYLESHRRCWEAAVRNPLGKRVVALIPQFVLGRGVIGSHPDQQYTDAWNTFWELNRMRLRIKQILRELLIYGEVFLRYFTTREGLKIRSVDPMTIWDIITDPDDLEDVKYYHQQYSVSNLYTSPVTAPRVPSTMVIRQIPAEEIDHFKINSTSSEKRGRSELFAVLGWLLRFKEFANDRILLNKMRAMFALDVMVDGDDSDLQNAEEKFATPPGPASVLVHNKAIEVDFKNANTSSGDAQTDMEMILKIIALGVGVSEQFLGVSNQTNRAAALIQAEPDVKSFEEKREIVEQMLMQMFDRVRTVRRLPVPDVKMEFTFPSLAAEDRSTKLKDLGYAEAMDWFTKKRSATMAAREFEVTTYDFTLERDAIKKERGTSPMIMQGQQQVPKVQPKPPAMPGAEGPLEQGSGKPPGFGAKPGVTSTSGQMGFPAKQGAGARGLPNTKATLNKPNFTKGGEQSRMANNGTSETPLRHAEPPAEGSKRVGWSEQARQKSLETRRQHALKRRELLEHGGTNRTD